MIDLLRWIRTGFFGAICSQVLPLSFVSVGWVQRSMRREVLRAWEREGGVELAGESALRRPLERPGWLLGSSEAKGLGRALGGLGENLRLGLGVMVNSWALTLPGCVLWLFSWYDGWNNSFYKGYEQAAVGPSIGLLGVALFILAMVYLPMAQARQASAGHWRAFWEVALVARLIRLRWWGCVRLAVLYALLGLPMMALKTAPIAFDRVPSWAGASDAQVHSILDAYFFWAGLAVFLAYALVRRVAARLYSQAVVVGIREGEIPAESLAEDERLALDRAGLLEVRDAPDRHVLVRAVRGGTRVALKAGAIAALVGVWLVFVSQIYVSEFLNHHPIVGWLNQPLVQLPWFRYLPPGLVP